MLGIAHVVLHLGLCGAIARAPAQTPVTTTVRLLDKGGDVMVDKTFTFERGEDSEKLLEFDTPQGALKLQIRVPKFGCSADDYLDLIAGQARNLSETLHDHPMPPTRPTLLDGTEPQAFLYIQPTFVAIDRSTACKAKIGQEYPLSIRVENDQHSYYAWAYPDASLYQHPVMLALKLGTATGEFHYVRIPVGFPNRWGGWPSTIQFSLSEDFIDQLATDPVNTLLCPRLFRTRVSG